MIALAYGFGVAIGIITAEMQWPWGVAVAAIGGIAFAVVEIRAKAAS